MGHADAVIGVGQGIPGERSRIFDIYTRNLTLNNYMLMLFKEVIN